MRLGPQPAIGVTALEEFGRISKSSMSLIAAPGATRGTQCSEDRSQV